jgi:hypothetical protein
MDYNVVLCRPVPVIFRVNKSKLHNECVSFFSNKYPLKVPVHKIQFYFALCIMELGNHMHYMAATAVLLHFVLRTQRSPLAVQFMPDGLLEVSELALFV